jgi:hypothetical protein
MSDFTDYQEQVFFGEVAEAHLELDELTRWKEHYESKRDKYPPWITSSGQRIKVNDIEDSHLDNLLKFVKKKDPNNETKWYDAFKAEKFYREIGTRINEAQLLCDDYSHVINIVF